MGSLFGLGAGTPTRFPYPDRPQPQPGIGPSQGQVVRARQVIVSGPAGGVFVYSPAPGAGNLIASISANPGTDPYGNRFLAGVASYQGTAASAVQGGVVSLYSLVGGVWLPYAALTADGTLATFQPSGGAGSANGTQLLSNGGAVALAVTPAGAAVTGGPFTSVAGTSGSPTVIETDTWNALTLQNGWAASGGNVRYRLMPDNTVWVLGQLNPAALTSTTFATMVAPYIPSVGGDFAVAAHTATPPTQGLFTRAANTGVLSALNATVGSGIFGVNMRYPLD